MTSAARRFVDAGVHISRDPVSADRLRLAAIALHKQGRIEDAIGLYRRGLSLDPADVSALRCLGTAYKTLGQLELAVACFRRAVELCPAFCEAWNNLGNTLSEQGDVDGAADCYRRAFTAQPQFAGAHFNYAQALDRLGRYDEAISAFGRAIELAPRSAEFYNGYARTLDRLGRFDEAVAAFRRATELAPRNAEFYNGLGLALYESQHIDEALAAYDQAIRLRPEFALPRYNRSHAWLLLGDCARGWAEYEWRWKLPEITAPPYAQPRWDGSVKPESTILLEAEQGLGDTIQFVRYVPLVKERVGKVVLRCQNPLAPLLKKLSGIDRVISRDEPVGEFDTWSPLMSLPLLFNTTLDSIPNPVPYLVADEGLVRFWQERLRRVDGIRVGIHWQGNPAFSRDRFRSIPLASFEPLAGIAGVRLISLQKGFGSEQLNPHSVRFPVIDLQLKLDEVHGPFLDTAAILHCLDLVITSDTALAHLAGALGVETWLAVPRVPEWRWLSGREDSPWYPTLSLFRQRCVGQWGDVFTEMTAALHKRAITRHSASLPDRQTLPVSRI